MTPEFVVFIEEAGLEQELRSNCNVLVRGVGHVSVGGAVNRIFDLIDKVFEKLIVVVGSPESRVVVLQSKGVNFCIGGIQVVK